MQKLNLTYVSRKEMTSKAGKPFTSISIKAKEHGDKFLSGFGNKDNASWKVGDEVEVEAVTSKDSNGKTYLNFEMPKPQPAQAAIDLSQVLTKLGKIELMLKYIYENMPKQPSKVAGTDIDYPVNPVTADQINFEDNGLDHLAEEHFNSI